MIIFLRYVGVGVINTAVHWVVFYTILPFIQVQSTSNVIAFAVAVLVSYILNSIFTFKKDFTGRRFILFTGFMALSAFLMGYIADILNLLPILTLVIFSFFSLLIGFIFSKYIVFKD